MNSERLRPPAYLLFIILSLLLLGYLFFKYVLMLIMPFLVAWGFAFAIRPAASFLASKTGINVKIVRPVLTISIAAASIALVFFGIFRLGREIWDMISGFGEGQMLRDFLTDLLSGGILSRLFGDFGDKIGEGIYNIAVSLLSSLGGVLTSFAGVIPRAFLFVIITLISSVYFAIDLERINKTVLGLLPQRAGESLKRFKDGFLSAAWRYARSYLSLFLMTLALMLVGLMILRVPYALLFAVIISILDLLPVLGVGTFLIPFGIFELLIGNTPLGAGILVLFALHTVLRQFLEPRIVGKNLGVHPLLTLIVLYVGYALFGFLGILLVPIFTVLIELAFGKKDAPEVG